MNLQNLNFIIFLHQHTFLIQILTYTSLNLVTRFVIDLMEKNFTCFTCQKKVIEFTILHCDHLICSYCLDMHLRNLNQISFVLCRCGVKTFGNEDSMRLSLRTPQVSEVKKELQKVKQLEDQQTQISNFFLNQTDFSYKDRNLLTNKENINTQNYKYITHPYVSQYNKFYLKTEPLSIDESNPFLFEQNHHHVESKVVRGVKSVQSTKSISPSSKISEKVSPRKFNQNQTTTKTASRIQPSNGGISSQGLLNPLSKQLGKQLKFLSIQFQKQLQKCENTFQKILKSIKSSYEKLIQQIQKFYLDQASEMDRIEKNQMNFQLPKMIKRKYESTIGKKINLLSLKLRECLEYIPKNGSLIQRETRQTVFLAQDIAKKQSNQRNKNSVSKSKRKVKECAIYLALSPKNKNDRVVNYIEVIKKQTVKTSKKTNLTKKTMKGEKIRIY